MNTILKQDPPDFRSPPTFHHHHRCPSCHYITLLQSFHVATNSFLANYTVGCMFAVGRHGYLLTLEKCIERIR